MKLQKQVPAPVILNFIQMTTSRTLSKNLQVPYPYIVIIKEGSTWCKTCRPCRATIVDLWEVQIFTCRLMENSCMLPIVVNRIPLLFFQLTNRAGWHLLIMCRHRERPLAISTSILQVTTFSLRTRIAMKS